MASSRKKSGKTFPESARIERLGIALCMTRVAEMGHIWREKGVDYGIDGEIELVHDGQVLNKVLWVQSKAKGDNIKFVGETDTALKFTCEQNDIDYWLSGTAPVLLVCSHPESGEAWFKHLPTWFADTKRRRERVVEFDKTHDRFDAGAAEKLLDLGVDKAGGVYLRPAPVDETLTTNLLRVTHLAGHVSVAPTPCRTWTDVNARMHKAGHGFFSDAVLRDGKIFTFRDLNTPPLNVLTSGSSEKIAVDELSDSEDPNDQALVTWLLNGTLRDIFHKDLRFHPERKLLYFKAPKNLSKKVRTSTRSVREVVRHYLPADGATWKPYVRHNAVETQFVYLDGTWFLSLTPTYHFTSDGRDDFPFGAAALSNMKRIEGHDAVRGQTKFWARYFAGSKDLFSGPEEQRLRFGDLETVDVDRGIDDSSWKPPPEGLDPAVPDPVSGAQRSLFANGGAA